MPDKAFAPGDIVAGKFRVEQALGAGGMGYVLGARHVSLDERVALKILHPQAATDGEAVARFFREARAASRIKGDHVVRVQDVGKLEDGTPYLVMEYLDGCDLSTLVERNGVLTVGLAVDYVLQACEALAEAHAVGIVHRDVKPSNLFLTKRIDGTACVKVLDFGISKAMHQIDATQPDFGMTRTQSVLGSPQYMAPEQMRSSKRVDGRTDIWAIGTIFHELLTGRSPFVAETMPELFAMILTDPTPSLLAIRKDIPEGLDIVVQRCLEKDPEKRYPNILEVARALAPFASTSKAESLERIERVTQNASLNMQAAAAASQSGSNPLLPEVLVAPPLTPSEPLDNAKTTIDPKPLAASSGNRRIGLIVAGFAILAVVGGGLGVFALMHSKPTTSAKPAAEPSAVTSVAAAVTEPMPTVSAIESAAAPPTASASTRAAASVASAVATARPRHNPPPVIRTTAAPPTSASATAAPTPSTTKPATTATSRYD